MSKQTLNVLDFMWVHKVKAGLLADDHPWVTGKIPGGNETIWHKNIVFASPRKKEWKEIKPEADKIIVTKIGKFLAAMIKRSNISSPEIPQGKKRRMPHAVNYIHGSVHYNGGFVIFDDFHDAMFFLSDPLFVKEFIRFARNEGRELTIILRERSFEPEEYAWFVSFVRARLKWYANGNGPTKKRILHGTPSPYPALNPINGSWIKDIRALRNGDNSRLLREPIECARYFAGEYRGSQFEYTFWERFHAWGQYLITFFKGFQAGLVFTRRKTIEPENWKKYQQTNGKWRPGYAISHPFMRIEAARNRRMRNKIIATVD